ncbi:SpaA isopeptide-forming pilin-related protein [Corynebacterium sp. BF-R-2]|uniref:SpaA isopeptide-forming pilin-related protein n=1 Tax=Corynebacterium sp. BF-R-2 TaxID=2943494 RepID=UPI00211E3A54|nr:SpaA isopeptide-forming pilin-related protein [Corynebacterium sp. BF-R-2]MCQ9676350.1 SpaA isopeptide-forming pilin-related protein [Corynebacterium sp. BF-R-2]
MKKRSFFSLFPFGATVSHLKNFAVSASRGSMAVFIVGVVVALVGAMMLFAPAGFAQEDPEADEALVAYDEASDVDGLAEESTSVETAIDDAPASASDSAPASASASGEEASEASEAVEKPEDSKDPVSVVRDGDIDTVTIDDRDAKAWRDSETGKEKVSDDALYGISRESDAGIDEIVEVEADGVVVDEDAYGFIYDDEDKLDKIVIDYYGLKTTPPETLTLKVKSSKEGEYSILDKGDIPAKAKVQDAGFLPDPSAEKQEKIDKAKKENRAADTQSGTRRLDTDAPTVERGSTNYPILNSAIGGSYTTTMFVNKIVVRDKRGSLIQGLAENGDIILKKQTHTCRLNSRNVEVLEKTGGKASLIAIDTSGCNTGANDRKLDIWEGQNPKNVISIQLRASSNSSADDFDVYLFASANQNEKAGDVRIPGGIPDEDEWTKDVDNGKLTTKTEALRTRGDFKVTMTREFDKGGDIDSAVSAQVKHINGAFLDNNAMLPKLTVLNADGSVIKEIEGKADEGVGVLDDLSGNHWGGVTFSQDVEGITVPNGGKIVVEMGFRKKSGARVEDHLNMQPLGPGSLNVDLASSDEHFELKTVGDIDATARVISRDNPYEDRIKITSRSKFEGATVTVKADPKSLFPGFAEGYGFEIYYPGGKPDGKTGIEKGYKLVIKDSKVDRAAGIVTYSVGVATEDDKPVDSALVEAGTQLSVKSLFASEPSGVKTTVEVEGKEIAKAADNSLVHGLGDIQKFPVGATSHKIIPTYQTDDLYGFNGPSGPFKLKDVNGNVTIGGLCIQPFYGYPGKEPSLNPADWVQRQTDFNPATGEPLPLENQRAVSYLLEKLYYNGADGAKAQAHIVRATTDIAKQAGLGELQKEYAFTAVYGAVLNLVGWDKASLQEAFKEQQPKGSTARDEAMDRGKIIAAWVLENVDLSTVDVNYQVLQPKGSQYFDPNGTGNGKWLPWQTVIVPGGSDLMMTTTASLEEKRFDDFRLQTVDLNEVDKAYDRVDFEGLDPQTKYVLKTEVYAVSESGERADKPVYQYGINSENPLTQDDIRNGYKDVAVDLTSIKDKLSVGRYVFFETIESGGKTVLQHANKDDLAQSFWIEESKGANFTFTKVSADNHEDKLTDASFVIANNKEMDGAQPVFPVEKGSATFTVKDLEIGQPYWLAETKAPSTSGKNYQLLPEPISFKIDTDGKLKFWSAGEWTTGDAFPFVDPKSTTDETTGKIYATANIANVWIGDLPKTGGNGIAPWLLLGGLIMAAGALMGNRRRA